MDISLSSQHESAWYYIDIVRRISVSIIHSRVSNRDLQPPLFNFADWVSVPQCPLCINRLKFVWGINKDIKEEFIYFRRKYDCQFLSGTRRFCRLFIVNHYQGGSFWFPFTSLKLNVVKYLKKWRWLWNVNYRAEASFSREKHRKQYMTIMLSMKFAGITDALNCFLKVIIQRLSLFDQITSCESNKNKVDKTS